MHRLRRISAALAVCLLLAGVSMTIGSVFAEAVPVSRVAANRLLQRISHRYEESSTEGEAAEILVQKSSLMNRTLGIRFHDAGDTEKDPPFVTVSLAEHPDWVVYDEQRHAFTPNERSIRYFLEDLQEQILPAPKHALGTLTDDGTIDIQGSTKEGYVIDSLSAASAIAEAFENDRREVVIDVQYEEPSLLLIMDHGVEKLDLLSRGLSDFEGSPFGREANIRRALHAYLNGIRIPAGEEFSFNEAMTDSSGWSPALIIGEGGTLVYEPGGGICQAASTVYRAALLAGLSITKRANHSLYVTYYEEYGVGLDATIYPGKQDLAFVNNTGADMVMVARADGTQAIVELYGRKDGRTVRLEGPFFSATSDDFEKALKINQIGWKYGVTYADGRESEHDVVSTYKAIPKKLREAFTREKADTNTLAALQ